MKRSLVALAVLGAFASAASAQSSVTIYGVVDLAITKGNGGTAFNQNANSTSEAYQVKQSTASRLGFRGNEDLGGGLSAQFDIQHRFTPDDGNSAAIFWNARSTVSLTSTAVGRVYLGRDYTPAWWIGLRSDPFGQNGVGQMGGRQYAGFSTQVATASTGAVTPGVTLPAGGTVPAGGGAPSAASPGIRTNNTVGYNTPNWGGFTGQAAVGLGEGAAGGTGQVSRETGVNLEYKVGGLYLGAGYEKLSGGTPSTATVNGDGSSLVNVAVHYDFGPVKPIFYYARSKVGLNNNLTNKFIQLGLTAPIGPVKLKVAYGRYDPDGADNTENKLGVGFDYSLSKRTVVYLDGGFAKQDLKTNNNAVALGISHAF